MNSFNFPTTFHALQSVLKMLAVMGHGDVDNRHKLWLLATGSWLLAQAHGASREFQSLKQPLVDCQVQALHQIKQLTRIHVAAGILSTHPGQSSTSRFNYLEICKLNHLEICKRNETPNHQSIISINSTKDIYQPHSPSSSLRETDLGSRDGASPTATTR
jgi:hypothetical protein